MSDVIQRGFFVSVDDLPLNRPYTIPESGLTLTTYQQRKLVDSGCPCGNCEFYAAEIFPNGRYIVRHETDGKVEAEGKFENFQKVEERGFFIPIPDLLDRKDRDNATFENGAITLTGEQMEKISNSTHYPCGFSQYYVAEVFPDGRYHVHHQTNGRITAEGTYR
jgi:hypothetical protein